MKRNWKVYRDYVTTKEALKVLCEQAYYESEVPAPFAIQSQKSERIITEYLDNSTITIDEAVNPWRILIIDTELEKKTIEIRGLLKNVSCSGYSWQKIDNMSLDDIWEYVSEVIARDDKKKYKILKYYFENNIYRKKNN